MYPCIVMIGVVDPKLDAKPTADLKGEFIEHKGIANPSYQKELTNTVEVFQKVFLHLDSLKVMLHCLCL